MLSELFGAPSSAFQAPFLPVAFTALDRLGPPPLAFT